MTNTDLKNLSVEYLKEMTYGKYPLPFYKAILFIIQREGGYSNIPNDPGGETKYGISKRSFPDEDIKNLTLARAVELYYKHFYRPLYKRCFALLERAGLTHKQRYAFELVVLDSSINHGRRAAYRFIQRAINKIISDPEGSFHYIAPLKVDGYIGPVTQGALKKICKTCPYNVLFMSGFILGFRLALYTRLAVRKSNYTFLRGWVNRIASIIDYVYTGC